MIPEEHEFGEAGGMSSGQVSRRGAKGGSLLYAVDSLAAGALAAYERMGRRRSLKIREKKLPLAKERESNYSNISGFYVCNFRGRSPLQTIVINRAAQRKYLMH